MTFKWLGFIWQTYIAYYPDYARSEDRSVRRAWWFLWHGAGSRFAAGQRCYRLCGVTLLGKRASPSTTGHKR